MKAQDLVDFVNQKQGQSIEEAMSSSNSEIINQMMRYMDNKSEEAKALILEKMSEKDFVKIISLIDSTILAGMTMHNKGVYLVLSKMEDDGFQEFTHTLILTVLGILVDEEVI